MVDIVIVNWNSGAFLKNCIESIFVNDIDHITGTVFIIDNNSSDSSLEVILNNDKIKVIKNNENLGFAKACNQGFRLCDSKYVLLLNPDTELQNNTLNECEIFLNRNMEVDILGCQLLDGKENITKSCSRFPSPSGFFKDALGLSKLAPSIFKPGILMTDFDHKESRFVDQVMGAFMFMRTTIFQKVGYFDEQFFVYFEEVDFSKRLADMGGETYFNSDIKAIHIGEGTTKSVKAFRLYLSLQSRLKYARKHFSKMGFMSTWLTTIIIEPFTRFFFLFFRGKFKDSFSIIKAYKKLIFK